MGQAGRPTVVIELSEEETRDAAPLDASAQLLQALALRSRIVLAVAEGKSDTLVARELACNRTTVGKWRHRFAEDRLEGLTDAPRPGVARTIGDEVIEAVVVETWNHPKDATTGRPGDGRTTRDQPTDRRRDLAGLRPQALAPRRVQGLPGPGPDREDPRPGRALLSPRSPPPSSRSRVAESQALDRSAPILPMLPTTPAKATHDYKRHGTLDLFAALEIATGKVITDLRKTHTAADFIAFLNKVDREVPADLDLHVILDNLSTHKTPAVHDGCCATHGSTSTSPRPTDRG